MYSLKLEHVSNWKHPAFYKMFLLEIFPFPLEMFSIQIEMFSIKMEMFSIQIESFLNLLETNADQIVLCCTIQGRGVDRLNCYGR